MPKYSYHDAQGEKQGSGETDGTSKRALSVNESSLASSAISAGTAWEGFGETSSIDTSKRLNASPAAIKKIADKVADVVAIENSDMPPDKKQKLLEKKKRGGIGGFIDRIKGAGKFYGQWLKDDPLGAVAAGGILALGGAVTAGVVTGIGAIVTGGLSGLAGLAGIWAAVKGWAAAFFTAAILPTLCSWIVSATQELWHFDWNITDEELDREVQNAFDAIYGILGDAAGRIVGQACGVIPGVVSVWVNPRLMNQVKDALGDEAYDAVLDGIYSIFGWSKQVFGKWAFATLYKNGRKFVKDIVRGSPYIQELLGPQRTKAITETWGSKDSKPWTFAQQYEEWIDSIDDKRVKAFVENFFDSAFEACGESLLVWANAVAV